MLDWALRQPFAVLGALGIISMIRDLITLHGDILVLIHAYQSMTQPIWSFLFGWVFDWLQAPFPGWIKDYLTLGTIISGANARYKLAHGSSKSKEISNAPWYLLFWPFILIEKLVRAVLTNRHVGNMVGRAKAEELQNKIRQYKRIKRKDPKAYAALCKEQLGDPIMWAEYDLNNSIWYLIRPTPDLQIFFEFLLWVAIILSTSYGLFLYDQKM